MTKTAINLGIHKVIVKKDACKKCHARKIAKCFESNKMRQNQKAKHYEFVNIPKGSFKKNQKFQTYDVDDCVYVVVGALKNTKKQQHLVLGSGFADFIQKAVDGTRKILSKTGNLLGNIPKAVETLFKGSQSYTNESKKTLKEYGDEKIYEIKLIRSPVDPRVTVLGDALTMGEFQKLYKKLGYDALMHLRLSAKTKKEPSEVVMEKTQQIDIHNRFGFEHNAEVLNVDMGSKKGQLTILEFVQNAKDYLGDDFFPYDAFNSNCQHFVRGLLAGSGLLKPEYEEWLFQDLTELKQSFKAFHKISRVATNANASLNALLGKGDGAVVKCPCGGKYGNAKTKRAHVKSQRHIKYMANK